MVVIYPRLIVLTASVGLAAVFFALRFDPRRPYAKILHCSVAGLTMLLIWNALPLPHVGVNPLAAWTAGVLGAPGIGLLAVLSKLP